MSKLSVRKKDLLISKYKRFKYIHPMDLNKDNDKNTKELIKCIQEHTLIGALTSSYKDYENALVKEELKLINAYLEYQGFPQSLFLQKII